MFRNLRALKTQDLKKQQQQQKENFVVQVNLI